MWRSPRLFEVHISAFLAACEGVETAWKCGFRAEKTEHRVGGVFSDLSSFSAPLFHDIFPFSICTFVLGKDFTA